MTGRDYNFISRLIHKIALQYNSVAEMSFDIESAAVKKRAELPTAHVFISGLARSGTTILLKYLYETGVFCSLTYADMPFVLMPNTWRKISQKKTSESAHQRAHADGIMIGPDSPEAFEEFFWRVFCSKKYIKNDRLLAHNVDADVSRKFNTYIANILSGGKTGKRYLSKNNNNILRLDYLQKAFPDAFIIVPFRDPLQQAISLLNQHVRFSDIQNRDQFSLNYMNWLGHFEFGLNQKPFFLDEAIFEEMQNHPKTDINFWLLTWKNYYGYLSARVSANTVLFNYEKFCADPAASLTQLFSKIKVGGAIPELNPFRHEIKTTAGVSEQLLEQCNAIYSKLVSYENSLLS